MAAYARDVTCRDAMRMQGSFKRRLSECRGKPRKYSNLVSLRGHCGVSTLSSPLVARATVVSTRPDNYAATTYVNIHEINARMT